MWAVGINQTSAILFTIPHDQGGYGFNQHTVGWIFWSPIIGTTAAAVFGHYVNDWIAARYIHKHKGVFMPETRLSPIYFAASLQVPGMVLVGEALKHHLHWIAIVMGGGIYVFGCIIATVAITAYSVDAYPAAAGEMSALINLSRLLGGFAVP